MYSNVGQYVLVFWPEESSISVVSEEDIVSPQLHKIESGVDCRVKVGRNVWPGKVAAVGKTNCSTYTCI